MGNAVKVMTHGAESPRSPLSLSELSLSASWASCSAFVSALTAGVVYDGDTTCCARPQAVRKRSPSRKKSVLHSGAVTEMCEEAEASVSVCSFCVQASSLNSSVR